MSEQSKFNKMIEVVYDINKKCYYLCTSRIDDGEQIAFLRKISAETARNYIEIYELVENRRDEHGFLYS